ncbi:hypothetical protein BHE74_00036548 [Ensete ventricosum]|nr:hypothetical protein BHE74_00036548 [Ensete ventricosum]
MPPSPLPTAGHCCPRAAAPTGWHHHLARPPSPQARPRALCPQATVTIGGHRVAGSFPCRWLLPVGGLGRSRPPLYGAWPWPAATTWGLAVIGRPCRGPGPWPATLIGGLAVAPFLFPHFLYCENAARTEIVYPCIPNPDTEDEGGQASSSLTVSTQWISVAKLLQSDLVTLV